MSRDRHLHVVLVLYALVAALMVPSVLYAQSFDANDEALDAQCTAAYDYTCAYPGADTHGQPCGFGKPVSSIQVIGYCVLQNRAIATQVISVEGDWGGPEAPTIEDGTYGVPDDTVSPDTFQPDTVTPDTETDVTDVSAPESSPDITETPSETAITPDQAPVVQTPTVEPSAAEPTVPTTEDVGSEEVPYTDTGSVPEELPEAATTPVQSTVPTVSADTAAPSQNIFESISTDVTSGVTSLYDNVASYFGFSPLESPGPVTNPEGIGIRG